MTPSTRDYFLFDDLLYDMHARQEHDWLVDILQNHLGVKVHYFEQMLVKALAAAPEAGRSLLIEQVRRLEADMPPVEQRIGQLEVMVRWFQGQGWPQYTQDPEGDPESAAPGSLPGSLAKLIAHPQTIEPPGAPEVGSADYLHYRLQSWSEEGNNNALAEELIEGIEARLGGESPSERPGPEDNGNGNSTRNNHNHLHSPGEDADALRRFVEGRLFYLTPLPNLMYTRDVGMVVNDHMLLGRMAAPGRARETLLFDFICRHHERFQSEKRWSLSDAPLDDFTWPLASAHSLQLEGGNVLQLREDLVILGVGQRTNMESVQRMADVWRAHALKSRKKLVLYVLRLPAGFNHLDSVLGAISPTECVVYQPVFEPYGPASVDVVRADLGSRRVRPTRSADFIESLSHDGIDFTPISCGGADPMDQQREQWFSAANLLAVAPGKVIIYRSPERTIAELARHGYRIVDINDVQVGAASISLDEPGKWALKIKGSELSRGHGGPHSLVMPLVRDGI
jgi:arginine deiminase